MMPFVFQLPAYGEGGTSAIVVAVPPATGIVTSLPAEKYAIVELSGLQNGKLPFAPASARVSEDWNECTQIWGELMNAPAAT